MGRRIWGIGLGTVALAALVVPAAPTQAAGVRYRDEVFRDIATTKDVVYGHARNVRGEWQTLHLDVHEPAGDTTARRAAVVWVHGGYFKRGTKEDYKPVWQQFARAGYVTVAIQYRLRPDMPGTVDDVVTQGRIDEYIDAVRDAQHDAQAAIRWVRANADRLRVDPELVAIAGHSAGGLTSHMVAFNDDDPGNSGNPGWSSRPAAVVAGAGGALPVKMTHVRPGAPPILLVHGLLDDVVPYVADPPDCVATIAMGNVCEQLLDPDHGHNDFGYAHWREFLHRWMIEREPLHVPARVTFTDARADEG